MSKFSEMYDERYNAKCALGVAEGICMIIEKALKNNKGLTMRTAYRQIETLKDIENKLYEMYGKEFHDVTD